MASAFFSNLFKLSRSALYRFVCEYYAAARWKLFQWRNPIHRYSSSQEEQIRCTERRRALLRKLLRRYPWWIGGHVNFGNEELQALQILDERPTPRALAIIRVSAEAALQLTASLNRLPTGKLSVVLEAKYLLAMVAFLKRDFDGALKYFHQLLALNNVPHLSRQVLTKALENGGAAAMATGNELLALEFFSRIPEDSRSSEARSAIALIQSKNPESY